MSSSDDNVAIAPREDALPARPLRQPARVDATALLGGGRELVIVHHEEEYRLRLTRKGKLILTK
jgi:hemin uptake protein HemP